MSMDKKQSAQDAALKYIARRDRTSGEIIEHLKIKEFDEEEINQTILYLEQMNYINDSDYANRFTQYLLQKGKGKGAIKQELIKKYISGEILEEILQDEELFNVGMERERALVHGEKIFRNLGDDLAVIEGDDWETKTMKYKEQQKVKGKIGRKLMSLGFSSDTTVWVINVLQDKFF